MAADGERKVREVRDDDGKLKAVVLEPAPKGRHLRQRIGLDKKAAAKAPAPEPEQGAWQPSDRPPFMERFADVFPRYADLDLKVAIAADEGRPKEVVRPAPVEVTVKAEPADRRPFMLRFDDVFPRYAGLTLADALAKEAEAAPRPEPVAEVRAPHAAEPAPPAEVVDATPAPSFHWTRPKRDVTLTPVPEEPPRVTFRIVRDEPVEARPFMLRFADVFPRYAHLSLADAIAADEGRPKEVVRSTPTAYEPRPRPDPRPFVRRFHEVFPRYAGMGLAAAIAADEGRPKEVVRVTPPPPPAPAPAAEPTPAAEARFAWTRPKVDVVVEAVPEVPPEPQKPTFRWTRSKREVAVAAVAPPPQTPPRPSFSWRRPKVARRVEAAPEEEAEAPTPPEPVAEDRTVRFHIDAVRVPDDLNARVDAIISRRHGRRDASLEERVDAAIQQQ